MCAPEKHTYVNCKYNTPQKRRHRLRQLGRCQACLVSVSTHGAECSERAKCRDHEGERHVYWTCDGPHTWHPGPQSIILHNINKMSKPRKDFNNEWIECEEDRVNCILCPSKYHAWYNCKYDSPDKVRKRLRQIGRCQSCMTLVEEHGLVCSHRARCIYHPGERHNTMTCSGIWFKHPGPQRMVDEILFSNGWKEL